MIRAVAIGAVTIAALVALVWAASVGFGRPAPSTQFTMSGQPMLPTTQVALGDTTVTAELATTPQEEAQGLSGRSGLGEGRAMLFIFDPPQAPGFWMKDMRFALDIIFAQGDGTIVTIYADLSPTTYPQTFHPASPVKYVLEVPAGFAAAHNVAIGGKIVVQ